jgi:thiol-disulfide isomerase/thioredoxin
MAVILATDQDFQSILEKNKKVAVKYYADWCGSCKLIAPKYRRLSDDERFNGTTFIEVHAELNENARKSAGVDNLPFFAVYKDGVLVEGSATSKEDVIVQMLSKIN